MIVLRGCWLACLHTWDSTTERQNLQDPSPLFPTKILGPRQPRVRTVNPNIHPMPELLAIHIRIQHRQRLHVASQHNPIRIPVYPVLGEVKVATGIYIQAVDFALGRGE